MFDLPPDPPKFWLPPKPAIIRSATPDLLRPVKQALVKNRRRGAGGGPVLTLISPRLEDTTDQNTYTFTNAPIGTAAVDRLVVIACGGRAGSVGRTVTGATIGGLAAANVVSGNRQSGSTLDSTLFSLPVAAGTTATITVTYGGSGIQCCSVAVYTITGLNSTTASHTNTANAGSATVATTLDILSGGVAIGMFVGETTATTIWTGLTEDFDGAVETRNMSSASQSNMAAETARAIQAVASAGSNNVLTVAAWR